jgi:hypothetical protein
VGTDNRREVSCSATCATGTVQADVPHERQTVNHVGAPDTRGDRAVNVQPAYPPAARSP